MKYALALIAIITLSSCTEEERAQQRGEIRKQLPDGCQIYDLGQYADIRRLVVVHCQNSQATTSATYRQGKTIVQYSVMVKG